MAPAGIPPVPAGTTSVPEGTSPAPVGATTQFLMSPCDLSIMVAVFVLINLLLMLIPALTAAAVMKSSLAVAMKVDATFILRYLPLPRLMTQALHLHKCISINVVMLTRLVKRPLSIERLLSLVDRAPNQRCHTMDRTLRMDALPMLPARTFLLVQTSARTSVTFLARVALLTSSNQRSIRLRLEALEACVVVAILADAALQTIP
jgi:hypothetical protein